LEKYFQQTPYPSDEDKEAIAQALDLTIKNVKVSGDDYYSTQNVKGVKKYLPLNVSQLNTLNESSN
jgi:hypothetical protein